MKKRILAILLALMVCVSLTPMTATATMPDDGNWTEHRIEYDKLGSTESNKPADEVGPLQLVASGKYSSDEYFAIELNNKDATIKTMSVTADQGYYEFTTPKQNGITICPMAGDTQSIKIDAGKAGQVKLKIRGSLSSGWHDTNIYVKVDEGKEKTINVSFRVSCNHDVETASSTSVAAKSPTCTENGNVEYYVCSICGGNYIFDSSGDKKIITTTIIPATGHTSSETYNKDATKHWKVCIVCNVHLSEGEHSFATTSEGKEQCSDCNYVKPSSGAGKPSGGGGGFYIPAQKPEIKTNDGGDTVLSSDGATLTIKPNEGKVIENVTLNGKDMGDVTELKGLKTGDKVEITFKDEVKAPTKEELDKKTKETVSGMNFKARSYKLKNGNIKVQVSGDMQEIKDLGYTVKYRFYRSTQKSKGYKFMREGTTGKYTNTKGLKGNKYFYKVRVMVYDKDGKLISRTALKQCTFASRTWTK